MTPTTHHYNTRSKKSFHVAVPSTNIPSYERVLILDVETTGLPKYSFVDSASSLQSQPYVIQLSYLILEICKETKAYHIAKDFDEYIQLPAENTTVPSFITTLTGITDEMCHGGKPMPDVLTEFCTDYKTCQAVVSHNLKFDSKMIMIELARHWREVVSQGFDDPSCIFNPIYNAMHDIELYCTMSNSIRVCNLKTAKGTLKNPKLTELFVFLYPNIPIPANLHNARTDTWVCYYCYLKLTRPELDICVYFPPPLTQPTAAAVDPLDEMTLPHTPLETVPVVECPAM